MFHEYFSRRNEIVWSIHASVQDIWDYYKVVVGHVKQVVVLYSVNTSRYYLLGGLMSGRYGEVLVL